jgi:hypothetical protein
MFKTLGHADDSPASLQEAHVAKALAHVLLNDTTAAQIALDAAIGASRAAADVAAQKADVAGQKADVAVHRADDAVTILMRKISIRIADGANELTAPAA